MPAPNTLPTKSSPEKIPQEWNVIHKQKTNWSRHVFKLTERQKMVPTHTSLYQPEAHNLNLPENRFLMHPHSPLPPQETKAKNSTTELHMYCTRNQWRLYTHVVLSKCENPPPWKHSKGKWKPKKRRKKGQVLTLRPASLPLSLLLFKQDLGIAL